VAGRTAFGLRLHAAGEHPAAALSLGVPVQRLRWTGVVLGGGLAALGGAWLVLEQHQFTAGMSSGRGFIALAALVFGKWTPRGAVLAVSSLMLSAAIVAFAASRSEVFAGAMMFVAGVGMITNNALINGLLQSRVPDRLRGRVLALYVTVYVGMNPLGSSLAGWLARSVGAAWAVGGMGALMFVIAAWVFRRYPVLRAA